MKQLILSLIMIYCIACKKSDTIISVDNTSGQNISILIAPNQTDNNYAATDESHYIVRNTKTHINKLLLFIGGSFSVPQNYNLVCGLGATIGLDVVSLSYPNNVATAPLGSNNDSLIFNNYRDELCFGNQVSSVVDVNVLNCIVTRTIKLLLHLKNTYPAENWGQYLSASNNIIWNKVILAGHSQGSGHACYIGKFNLADRVVMLSGPNDFSTNYNRPANWLTQVGQTPINKHFSLLHTQDEIVPYTFQVANLKALGMLSLSASPTLVDNLAAPFSNARSMSLNIPATSYHNATVGANAILQNVWSYMFTN